MQVMPEIFFILVLVHHRSIHQNANVVGNGVTGIKTGVELWGDVRAGEKLALGTKHGRIGNVGHVNG